jgi:hypothetical protein
LDAFFNWLEATSIATWTRTSPSLWAYPTILTLHTVGLGIVVGASAVLDLRLLGYGRRIALPSLQPLFRILWWGFALNAASGILLFMSEATTKGKQPVFFIKLTLIALALVATVQTKRVITPVASASPVTPIEPGPRGARLAIASLALWAGAITAGRLMAYF